MLRKIMCLSLAIVMLGMANLLAGCRQSPQIERSREFQSSATEVDRHTVPAGDSDD